MRRQPMRSPLQPNTLLYSPAHLEHVDDFRRENTMAAAQEDPSVDRKHHDFHMGEHDTERLGIEKMLASVDTQEVHPQEQMHHLLPAHSIAYLTSEVERLASDVKQLLTQTYRRRTFVDTPVVVSQHVSFPLEYSQRLNLYIYSPQKTITLALGDGGSLTVFPMTWTNISFGRGTLVTAPQISDLQPVTLILRATDELFSEDIYQKSLASTNSGHVAIAGGSQIIKAAPGILGTIVVNVAGTTAFFVFDNAVAASGFLMYSSPAATAQGQIFPIYGWAKNGIAVANTAGTGPDLTVFFD